MEKPEQPWKELEEEEEEEDEVGLRGRQHRQSEIITTITTSDSRNADLVLSAELENGADELMNQEQDVEEEELQNGTVTDSNGTENVVHKQIEELNGEEKSEKNVYYDQNDGIWKCRNCCWTYQSGNPWTDHMQNRKWHLHMPMNFKTVDQHGPRFVSETEAAESTDGFSGTKHCETQCSDSERNIGNDVLHVTIKNHEIANGLGTVDNHHYQANLKSNGLSGFNPPPSEKSLEFSSTSYKSSNNDIGEDLDGTIIYDSDLEVPDLDVERVLEQQETHDLYCPNCNSCITKKVILRKRKRRFRKFGEEAKRNRLETILNDELDIVTENATFNHGPEAVDNSLEGSPAPPGAEDDREPDVFRCLSCFSFFIPTGSGIKLIQIFGGKSERDNVQNARQTPTVNKHWFSSIFSSSKAEATLDQGSRPTSDAEKNNVGAPVPSMKLNSQSGQAASLKDSSSTQAIGIGAVGKSSTAELPEGGKVVPPSTRGSELLGKVTVDVQEKLEDAMEKGKGGAVLDHSDANLVNLLNSSSSSGKMPPNREGDHPATQQANKTPINVGEPAENGIFVSQQDGLKLLVSSKDSLVVEISKTDHYPTEEKTDENGLLVAAEPVSVLGESDVDGKASILKDILWENDQIVGAALIRQAVIEEENDKFKKSDKDGAYSYEVTQHTVTQTTLNIRTNEPLQADNKDAHFPSVHDSLLVQDRQIDIVQSWKEMPSESKGGMDTIIVVKEQPVQPATSEMAKNVGGSVETGTLPHTQIQIQEGGQRVTRTREVRRLEIIKSVVYGGLMESITSLGVVSSAAGAEAATLNVLALCLANMIGGLFIIGHNLWDLKKDHSEVTSNQITEGVDRYQEQLGRRENFWLHATFAVLSFLVFGLAPPVIYGFSFRVSNDRDFKLIAVAGASLLCIIILGTGKAYVQRPPKSYLKTVVYYVIMGFMASGISYVAGELIKKLAEKLGLFEQSSVVTLPLLEKTPMDQPWKSY